MTVSQPADVIRLVMRETMAVAAAGGAAGVVAALALTRLLSGLLYGVGETDPATFASACLLLALVAGTATYLPARRATRVDPVRALSST